MGILDQKWPKMAIFGQNQHNQKYDHGEYLWKEHEKTRSPLKE